MNNLIFKSGDDWTFPGIARICDEIEKIGHEELKLETYPNQVEIVDFEGMVNCYALIGMPFLYNHWSFGKAFIRTKKSYLSGNQSLAYEMVINSNPVINYLLDQNDMATQCMVLAHSAIGHNSFFKNNYLFRKFTKAGAIIDYLKYAKKYIQRCEEKYGEEEVESWLDSCHTIQYQGIDTATRIETKRDEIELEKKMIKESERLIENYNHIWENTAPNRNTKEEPLYGERKTEGELDKPEENILYFIEENATWLPSWKREIIRIVRKINQYFGFQGITKVSNEGWAVFNHYYIMNSLYEKGMIDDGTFIQFLNMHTSVITQHSFDKPWYNGFNPYHLGYNIYRDIKRICENPTEEDLEYLPQLKGVHWIDGVKDAMMNYSDATLISQYLSPKVIRDMHLFTIENFIDDDYVTVTEIHDDNGYNKIRQILSVKHERNYNIPNVQVVGANLKGDRTLTLKYFPFNNRDLDIKNADETYNHISYLWGFAVEWA